MLSLHTGIREEALCLVMIQWPWCMMDSKAGKAGQFMVASAKVGPRITQLSISESRSRLTEIFILKDGNHVRFHNF